MALRFPIFWAIKSQNTDSQMGARSHQQHWDPNTNVLGESVCAGVVVTSAIVSWRRATKKLFQAAWHGQNHLGDHTMCVNAVYTVLIWVSLQRSCRASSSPATSSHPYIGEFFLISVTNISELCAIPHYSNQTPFSLFCSVFLRSFSKDVNQLFWPRRWCGTRNMQVLARLSCVQGSRSISLTSGNRRRWANLAWPIISISLAAIKARAYTEDYQC